MGGKFTPFGAWYTATKHILEGWSQGWSHCLRVETAPHNIQAAVVESGFIKTEFNQGLENSLGKYYQTPVLDKSTREGGRFPTCNEATGTSKLLPQLTSHSERASPWGRMDQALPDCGSSLSPMAKAGKPQEQTTAGFPSPLSSPHQASPSPKPAQGQFPAAPLSRTRVTKYYGDTAYRPQLDNLIKRVRNGGHGRGRRHVKGDMAQLMSRYH